MVSVINSLAKVNFTSLSLNNISRHVFLSSSKSSGNACLSGSKTTGPLASLKGGISENATAGIGMDDTVIKYQNKNVSH